MPVSTLEFVSFAFHVPSKLPYNVQLSMFVSVGVYVNEIELVEDQVLLAGVVRLTVGFNEYIVNVWFKH